MQKIIIYFFYFIFFTSIIILLSFIGFVFYRGISAFSLEIIFDNEPIIKAIFGEARVFDGIFNAIVGSFLVSSLAIIFALPFGFLSGVYIAIFANNKLKKFFSFSYELLASVPSIVIGLFGLSITIFLHRLYFDDLYTCLLISAISLAVLITPYIVKITDHSLSSIPTHINSSALNLGATKYQNLFYIQLPYISKSLVGGTILAIGRAIEDTAVIMLTGTAIMAGIPNSVLEKYEAIPFFMFYISSQYQDLNDINKGYAAAMILLLLSSILFIIAFMLEKLTLKRSNIEQ